MATVVLLGTLDTKGHEYRYMADQIRAAGHQALLVDAGILGQPQVDVDITRAEVAAVAGHDVNQLAEAGDRGAAVATMAEGAARVVADLHADSRLDGILGLGGSGGTALVTHAMRELPVGVPKLMVSTVASGDTKPYVGAVDIAMMYSVVDIAGINQISSRILTNAAAAMIGMVGAPPPPSEAVEERTLIGATMFGVTTPAVTEARTRLEDLGYEVLVFHATGTGGDSMENLMRAGFISGVFDLTTTELCDLLVGGVFAPSQDRLTVAGELGLPQVVSLGALDMVNFGAYDTVPPQFVDRNLYRHNPSVTLMRTTPEECAELGRMVAERLNRAKGPVTLFVPLKGVSMIAVDGQPFHDPEADAALFTAIREHLDQDVVELRELDTDINDPGFAAAMVEDLHGHLQHHAAQ
jgi:uncharacterized protein (UPF0261 family)